jgi:hypothetical protein
MATRQQEEFAREAMDREGAGGWAFDAIVTGIDAGTIKADSKKDVRLWLQEQRALGRTHLFASPPKEKEKGDGVNPFHPSTWSVTGQGAKARVGDGSLAASLAAQVGPGAFLGMTLKQAQAAAAKKTALKD